MSPGPEDMSAYRHVIWDWNGTLLDDAWLCVEITSGLLRRRHLEPLTPERYERLFDFPVRIYYERLGFDLEAESFEEIGSEFIEEYRVRRYECRLQEGAGDDPFWPGLARSGQNRGQRRKANCRCGTRTHTSS